MQKVLEQIGLTPTESKVYLSLLELGESKVGDILDKARLNSGRIYDVLNALKNKGLLSSVTRSGVKFFIPSPPSRINDLLQEKFEAVKSDQVSFEKVLPSLSKKFGKLKNRTNIEVFLGINGCKTAYSILFKEASKDKNLYVQGIVSKQRYSRELLNLLQYYVYKKRIELKLKTKKLVSQEARDENLYAQDKSMIRYIPFESMTGIELLGDVALIELPKDPIITIVIRDAEVVKDLKNQFEFLWKQAKS